MRCCVRVVFGNAVFKGIQAVCCLCMISATQYDIKKYFVLPATMFVRILQCKCVYCVRVVYQNVIFNGLYAHCRPCVMSATQYNIKKFFVLPSTMFVGILQCKCVYYVHVVYQNAIFKGL